MQRHEIQLNINQKLGSVSGILDIPQTPEAMVLLAHGAGAGMRHAFLEDLANALTQRDLAVLRFQFPYMENGGRPNKPEKDHFTILSALEFAATAHPELPLFLSGKSYGGRMSSQTVSLHPNVASRGLIFYGFPLHPPGRVHKSRAEHLYTIEQPLLFLQGTRDALANLELIQEVVADCKNARVEILETADHSFKTPKKSGKSRADNINWLADKALQFIQDTLAN